MTARLAAAVVVALLLPALLFAARGDLDPTFGSGGKVRTDFGGSEIGWAVAVQRDGRVVVAGGRSDSESDDFVLARYTVKGRLDRSFDEDGKVETDFGGGLDAASDVQVQPDGRIVAAGRSSLGGEVADGADMALARYNRDGSLDESFGDGGTVLTTFEPSGIAGASAVAIQADGKIVAGGHAGTGPEADFALARYLPDGELDESFGEGGQVTTPVSAVTDWLLALAVQPDGKLVAAGYSHQSLSRGHIALARYTRDGSLDPSFDGDGVVVATFLPPGMVGEQLLLQRNRRLLVAGIGGVSRFNGDGSLDRNFGDGGRALSGNVQAHTAAIQPDGKILVIGAVSRGSSVGDFGVARLTAGGRLDTTYGRRGSVVTGFSPGSDDVPEDGVLLPDGRLVVAGMTGPRTEPNTWGPWDFAVARYVAIRFCVVPSVRGQTLSRARIRLERAGCRLGRVEPAYSRRFGQGRVISQRPRARARRAELAKVDLVVSRGRRR